MRVIVTGSREWSDWGAIRRELRKLPPDTILIHGDCRGADRMAKFVGKQLGFTVLDYPADWDRYRGQRPNPAGFIRNQEMVDKNPGTDLVLAFQKDGSGGTQDMIDRCIRAGFEVRVIEG